MYTLRISRIGQRDIIFSVIQMNPPDHLLHVSGTHAAVKSDRINRINRRRFSDQFSGAQPCITIAKLIDTELNHHKQVSVFFNSPDGRKNMFHIRKGFKGQDIDTFLHKRPGDFVILGLCVRDTAVHRNRPNVPRNINLPLGL